MALQPFELSSTNIEMPTMTTQNSSLARELFLLLVLATLWGSSY
ncbi:EamA/RhaT family transporter, partial [Rhizobium johnstonii]